jgi:hypothetical protein
MRREGAMGIQSLYSNGGKTTYSNNKKEHHMCHECEHEDDNGRNEVQFDSHYVDELQSMPPDLKDELIGKITGLMGHVIERAEAQGFLFELITEWPRQKVAMYEAAVVMEKNILDDEDY